MRVQARWHHASRSLMLRTSTSMHGHLSGLTSAGRYAITTDRGTAYIDAEEASRMRLEFRRDDTAPWLPYGDAVMTAIIRPLADAPLGVSRGGRACPQRARPERRRYASSRRSAEPDLA